jgi:anion-transporting  ArsA/GET3 family ATPase
MPERHASPAKHQSEEPLGRRLGELGICICAGPGGVGKTTVAAAVGLGLARDGKRVLVLTIDPARRLAGALGLGAESLATRARVSGHRSSPPPHTHDRKTPATQARDGAAAAAVQVSPAHLQAAGIALDGELWAMTLDVGDTFDRLIAELAADREAYTALRDNPIYRELAADAAGSQEVAAVAKLFELDRERAFDVVVLDTPPSRHALDFLDAPARLGTFLESRAMSLLLLSGGGGTADHSQASGPGAARAPLGLFGRLSPRATAGRLLGGGAGALVALFARATGLEVIGDLADFVRLLGNVSEGLRERAANVEALLADPATGFLIVTSPEYEPGQEAIFLHRRLADAGMAYTGLVVNRVHESPEVAGDATAITAQLGALLGDGLGERVLRSRDEMSVLVQRDRRSVTELSKALGEHAPVTIPEVGEDVDALQGLAAVAARLLG